MKTKVMVCRVNAGATLVTVPIELNGATLLCVFITRKGELARVGIFDSKPLESGPLWILESYTRRIVPSQAIRDALERAREALRAFDARSERDTSFDCSVDVANAS